MFVEISYLIGEKETVLIESLSKPRLIARTRMNEGGKNNTSILVDRSLINILYITL